MTAATAIGEAIGCTVTLLSALPWASSTFSGHRILIESAADLPGNLEQIDADRPGFVLIDVAQISARRAEAVLVSTS